VAPVATTMVERRATGLRKLGCIEKWNTIFMTKIITE